MQQTEQIKWISPNLIVHKNNNKSTYNGMYKEKDIEDAVNWIPFYKGMKDSGISDKEIFEIKPIAKAYDIFFKRMIKVEHRNDNYYLLGQEDKRIEIAILQHIPSIPVLMY